MQKNEHHWITAITHKHARAVFEPLETALRVIIDHDTQILTFLRTRGGAAHRSDDRLIVVVALAVLLLVRIERDHIFGFCAAFDHGFADNAQF